MKKILIAGAGGQLGREFTDYLSGRGVDFIAPAEQDFDVTDFDSIGAAVRRIKPGIIINCAAYNQVDAAEDEPDTAFKVNAGAVRNLAALCRQENIFLVHYSSDYVFDGSKGSPYTEEDAPNLYGKSKLEGERAVQETLRDYLIFRTSWVFGKGKQNFLYKLSSWAKEKKELRIAEDEVSCPT